jgi:hydroxyacylglutathione hydrolase
MKFIPLPAFQDNDLWLLHDGHRARAADPGDAQPVLAALQHHGLQLQAILVMRPGRDPRVCGTARRHNA